MPFNEQLADRVRELIAPATKEIEEKRMFSGLCFMVNHKMCVAVSSDRIMIRFDPEKTDEVLEKDGVRPMVMSGKHLQGYVYVDEGVLGTQKQLGYWVGLALEFNKFAKPSKGAGKKKAAGKAGTAKKAGTTRKAGTAKIARAVKKPMKKAAKKAAGKKKAAPKKKKARKV